LLLRGNWQARSVAIIQKAEERPATLALVDTARKLEADVIGPDDHVALGRGLIGREPLGERNAQPVHDQHCDRCDCVPRHEHVSRQGVRVEFDAKKKQDRGNAAPLEQDTRGCPAAAAGGGRLTNIEGAQDLRRSEKGDERECPELQ
jgi:hypothetical protein